MTVENLPRSTARRSLAVAGVFLATSTAISLLTPQAPAPQAGHRWLGFLMGAVVVFYSNAASKALPPLSRMRWDPAAEQAMRRFTAWSLTLGGLAYALTWIIAPWEIAGVLALALLGSALLLTLVRFAWCIAKGSRK